MKLLKRTAKDNRPIKVLQFGGGNFLRAFVDWMIDILNEVTTFNGNVIIIKPTERGDYQPLKNQEGLFHVILNGIKNGKRVEEIRLVKSVTRVVHAYKEWDTFLETAKNKDLRFIISNTTEAGIVFNQKDKFDLTKTPTEFPAKLTLWLYQRFKHFQGAADKGCILLPLELIGDNGNALKLAVLRYINYWKLDKAFSGWVNKHNHFCNTLVDRIVAGFPTEKAAEITKRIGYQDDLLVAGELYHSWIIQAPDFAAKELPFSKTKLNVQFTNDLDIHRQIKVRLLNGAHTAMVPVGLLAGVQLVSEAMAHPQVSRYIEGLLKEEVIPTIDYPKAELATFTESVFNRFRNPSIQHQLISIALNSTSKYITRLAYTLKDYLQQKGKFPNRIVFALAALIRLYKGEINEQTITLKDKLSSLHFFKESWTNFDGDYAKLVRNLLSNDAIWEEDLTQIPNLSEKVATYLERIDTQGMVEALNNLERGK